MTLLALVVKLCVRLTYTSTAMRRDSAASATLASCPDVVSSAMRYLCATACL
jgi:hypothetical protein